MKKIIILLTLSLFLVSCGYNDKKNNTQNIVSSGKIQNINKVDMISTGITNNLEGQDLKSIDGTGFIDKNKELVPVDGGAVIKEGELKDDKNLIYSNEIQDFVEKISANPDILLKINCDDFNNLDTKNFCNKQKIEYVGLFDKQTKGTKK